MLTEAGKKALRRKATIDWQSILADATKYLGDVSIEEWKTRFHPVLEGVIRDQAENTGKVMLGASFDVPNLFAQQWFQDYELVFAQQINATSNEQLRQLLQAAMAEGLSIAETQRRIDALFRQWTTGDADPALLAWAIERMPAHRTEMIARTESMRGSNLGLFHIYQDWGIQRKTWLATHDARTREDHITAGRMYAEGGSPGPIPFDQPFMVGGYRMMMPHDPSAPASQSVACRCVLAPVVGQADVDAIREQAAAIAREGPS